MHRRPSVSKGCRVTSTTRGIEVAASDVVVTAVVFFAVYRFILGIIVQQQRRTNAHVHHLLSSSHFYPVFSALLVSLGRTVLRRRRRSRQAKEGRAYTYSIIYHGRSTMSEDDHMKMMMMMTMVKMTKILTAASFFFLDHVFVRLSGKKMHDACMKPTVSLRRRTVTTAS